MKGQGKGWKGESRRHSLARKGVTTNKVMKSSGAFDKLALSRWSEDAKSITDPEIRKFLKVNMHKFDLVSSSKERIIKNFNLFKNNMAEYDKRDGARVGDFVEMPDGKLRRFTYDFGDGIQTGWGGSYYLGNGYISYSGSLDPSNLLLLSYRQSIPKEKLILHPEIKEMDGMVWTFMDDIMGGGRGIKGKMKFRVFKYMGDE